MTMPLAANEAYPDEAPEDRVPRDTPLSAVLRMYKTLRMQTRKLTHLPRFARGVGAGGGLR